MLEKKKKKKPISPFSQPEGIPGALFRAGTVATYVVQPAGLPNDGIVIDLGPCLLLWRLFYKQVLSVIHVLAVNIEEMDEEVVFYGE